MNLVNLRDTTPAFSNKREHIHIRLTQQGKKFKTAICGLVDEDLSGLLKVLKSKICNCSGSIEKDEDDNQLIILFGDQRDKVKSYLITKGKISEEDITVHGA